MFDFKFSNLEYFFRKLQHNKLSTELIELNLTREYKFMYEGFILQNQRDTYLFLDSDEVNVYGLKFESTYLSKFGYPNDEGIESHELVKFNLSGYTFYEVKNSPWIKEILKDRSSDKRFQKYFFDGKKHFIATMKDNTFEIISNNYKEISLSKKDLLEMINEEILFLRDQGSDLK